MAPFDDFVRSQILSLTTRSAAMPRPALCMIVKRVAPRSVAAAAGIAPKDLLASMDGKPASQLVPELHIFRAPRHEYVFYARARHEAIDLATTGLDLGVELAFTPEAIRASYDPKQPSYKALEALWEARDHATLETLAADTMARMPRDTPALLYRGAALYEAGRFDEALPLLAEYQSQYASHWTMNFTAVGLYYLGLEALRGGRRDQGIGLLETAYDHNAFDRIAAALEKHTGRRPAPPSSPWLNKRFPIDYELTALARSPTTVVSLSKTLAGMPPYKLLILCLLDGYRGNGPYDSFLSRYLSWAEPFAPFLYGVQAITEIAERPAGRDHYFRSEDKVREARYPFALLHDPQGLVSAAIQPQGSPHIMVLDQAANVRYEGELEGTDLWEMLGRAIR